jgi:hypothetical protein
MEDWKVYLMPQLTSFVVLMQGGRVGSAYLISALDSHPSIRAYQEILVDKESSEQVEVYTRLLRSKVISKVKAVGFKTKLSDVVDPETFSEYLNRNGVKVIALRRRNLVKIVVSWINCERLFKATGRYHLYGSDDPVDPTHLDLDDFAVRLHCVSEQRDRFEEFVWGQLETQVLTIWYEDMFSSESHEAISSVLRFLGVKIRPVHGTTSKVTSDDLSDAIANYEELRTAYFGTEYEEMFV